MDKYQRQTIIHALELMKEDAEENCADTEEREAIIYQCEDAADALEAAPAMEPVPDGYYGDLSIEDDGKVVGFFFDDELGYASADLPDGMVIMRPAADTNDSEGG